QFNNRTLVFDYDAQGNLVRASLPAVGGTPTGNDFVSGKTFRYRYDANHQLTHIWHPNEVRNTVNSNPPDTSAAEIVEYYPDGDFAGMVHYYTVGGTNGNGVPSGGTITYDYTDLEDGSLQVAVTNRNRNQSVYVWNSDKTLASHREFTRGLRSLELPEYEHRYEYNEDRLLRKETAPNGNTVEYTYNDASPDRCQHNNLIRTVRRREGLPGDQAKIETVTVYEPIYHQPALV